MEGGTGDQWQKRQLSNGRRDRWPMAEVTAIQWKEGQVTNGNSDGYQMEGGTGDQWQKRQQSKRRRGRWPMAGGTYDQWREGQVVCLLRICVHCTLYTVHSTAGPWEIGRSTIVRWMNCLENECVKFWLNFSSLCLPRSDWSSWILKLIYLHGAFRERGWGGRRGKWQVSHNRVENLSLRGEEPIPGTESGIK